MIKKIIIASIGVFVYLGIIGNSMASIQSFIREVENIQYDVIKKEYGENKLYMNYGVEEFKSGVVNDLRNSKNESDELFRALGLKTEGESHSERIRYHMNTDRFNKAMRSPAIALNSLKTVYINYQKILDNKNINLYRYYTDDVEDNSNYRDKIDGIFEDWEWYLQGVSGRGVISLKEISENNTNLGWVLLHEMAHIYKDGGTDLWDLLVKEKKTIS